MITRKVTKEEFKKRYFEYEKTNPGTGWTADYWDHFYEKEMGMKYEITEPESPAANVMWIGGEKMDTHRMFFLSEDQTDSFFDFPGKE
jgi:hypothetical protein